MVDVGRKVGLTPTRIAQVAKRVLRVVAANECRRQSLPSVYDLSVYRDGLPGGMVEARSKGQEWLKLIDVEARSLRDQGRTNP